MFINPLIILLNIKCLAFNKKNEKYSQLNVKFKTSPVVNYVLNQLKLWYVKWIVKKNITNVNHLPLVLIQNSLCYTK